MLLGGTVVLAFVWLIVTGLLARNELRQLREEVRVMRSQVTAADFTAARTTAQRIAEHAERARVLTTGPVWAGLAALPGGEPLRTVRVMTAQLDGFGRGVLPGLVAASTRLDPATLRLPGGRIDVARIGATAPVLDHALLRLDELTATVSAQPARTWLGPVDTARRELIRQLAGVRHTLKSADLAAHIAPAMLGQDGVRRYFVAFQNEAEARGTGGIPGAFAIMRADAGKVSFERFEPDAFLAETPVDPQLGAGYDALFRGTRSTSLYVNTNLSPHYPYAARTWLAMWQTRTGQRLDGAIALDPTVLGYLLDVTGPVRVADSTTVTADNVVALTQSTVYARFPRPSQNNARKTYLLDLARAVSAKVLASPTDPAALVRAGAKAAGQRRILVYSTAPAIERQLDQTSMSGAIPVTRAPYVGMAIVNDGGNKLDYYLDRSLTWQAQGCGSIRDVTVTMTLRNNAPGSGLSPYVTSRSDDHSYPVRPGDNREEISYYATSGAVMQSLTVNGQPASAEAATDLGHPVFTLEVEVPRGRTTTVVLRLTEPDNGEPPTVLRQPLVRPLYVRVDQGRCT